MGRTIPELDEPGISGAQFGDESTEPCVVRVPGCGQPKVSDQAGNLLLMLFGGLDRNCAGRGLLDQVNWAWSAT